MNHVRIFLVAFSCLAAVAAAGLIANIPSRSAAGDFDWKWQTPSSAEEVQWKKVKSEDNARLTPRLRQLMKKQEVEWLSEDEAGELLSAGFDFWNRGDMRNAYGLFAAAWADLDENVDTREKAATRDTAAFFATRARDELCSNIKTRPICILRGRNIDEFKYPLVGMYSTIFTGYKVAGYANSDLPAEYRALNRQLCEAARGKVLAALDAEPDYEKWDTKARQRARDDECR